ncbi:class I SAM-dependent methyltransferase [Pigmentiphaga soli]|uniref:Class I SAM-dependent methyltransferase n=1 Tax=Pigmentiphaga soli TaxID=1007095 RepID=A0ABP8HDS8_9BURK
MDPATLSAYDRQAAAFADDWLAQPAPDDMYALLARHFTPGPTADVGCGAGRDVAWLASHGFDAIGYDASSALLQEARRRHPQLRFEQSALPGLPGIGSARFQNVLCETVIMHLDPPQIGPAVRRLLQILRAGGHLYLSWRVTAGTAQRDRHRRLYSAFDASLVLDECAGHEILMDAEEVSASSGKTVHRVIVRKTNA